MFAGLPALLAGLRARPAHAEPPPEVTQAKGVDWRFLNKIKREMKT
jgi:hypothetical protein